MKTIEFGSAEQGRCYLERGNKDGGMVVCYMVQEQDGTYTSYRSWHSDPVRAQAEYDKAAATEINERITTIRAALTPVREVDGVVEGGSR